MIYATPYKGNSKVTRRRKATTIAPQVKPVCKPDGIYKGRRRNTKRQPQGRAGGNASNAFLKTMFAPKLQEPEFIQDSTDTAQMERDFYTSLSQLAKLYNIEMQPTRSLGFPYNIAQALEDIREQLKSTTDEWQKVRLLYAEESTFFATEKRFNTGTTLYYIPVFPLYLMLKDPKHRHTALLLLSVCTYLYKIADIPYYRQEGYYLHYMYDSIKQMYEDEQEEPDPTLLAAFKTNELVGDVMERKFLNPENLTRFKYRVTLFKGSSKFDKECHEVAKRAFALYEQFPNMSIHNKFKATVDLDEDEDCYVVTMEKYISFFASGIGRLSDLLIEFVNNDMQDYSHIEEPVIYEPLDGREMKDNDFEFEQRIFALINDVTTLLYQYENQQL